MREFIDGAAFTEMILCASDALDQNKQRINELNVFPVPDGDTGTNMSLTMACAADALRRKQPDSVDAVADAAASALLRGARGNSGVILSLLFRGIAKSLKGKPVADAPTLAAAMRDGVDAAYKAVMKPAEGTILTVTRVSAASAVEFAEAGSDLELMLICALEAAKDALDRTIDQNPVLKRAGVIDAGGMGFVTILDAMLGSLQGRVVSSDGTRTPDTLAEGSAFSVFDTGEIEFAYDTVYIVRKTTDKPLDLLRAYLDSIGDSLVIAEDDDVFKVHVHTNIPGEALTESQKYGTLETAKIENMRTQHDELVQGESGGSEVAPAVKELGVVAVCAGDGLARLFRELGADNIVTGGQTMNPSTEDILKAVNQTPASTVFVLPNNKNIIMAAEQAAPLTEKQLVVIPTTTVPQGISCLLSLDPDAEPENIEAAMKEVIPTVHTAQVTYAARDSDFDGYAIKAGEYLALLDGALVGSFGEKDELLRSLSDSLRELDPALLTVYYGEEVPDDEAEKVSAQLEAAFPDAEVSLVNGGQPVYYLLIAAE